MELMLTDRARLTVPRCLLSIEHAYEKERKHPETRATMNHRKHVSALLALVAFQLITVSCKDKTPPPPPPPEGAATTPPPTSSDPASPDSFRVKFATTKGDFMVEVTRAWAPKGTDRFYLLVRD